MIENKIQRKYKLFPYFTMNNRQFMEKQVGLFIRKELDFLVNKSKENFRKMTENELNKNKDYAFGYGTFNINSQNHVIITTGI